MSLNRFSIFFRGFDVALLLGAGIILGFSFLTLWGASMGTAEATSALFKQGVSLFLGVTLFFILSFLDYRFFRASSNWLYLLGLAILIAVLLFGKTFRGTTGWFSFGGWNLQPAEFAKIIAVIFLSRYFSEYARALHQWRHLALSGFGVAILALLILAQPDFGSATIYVFLWIFFVFAIGIPLRRTITILSAMCVVALIAWNFFFVDYQRDRIMTFLSAANDPFGAGYNITQSMVAIGSGGVFGKGLGAGSQSRLRFLPARETDFIFSVMTEAFGLVGVFLFLGAWALFFWRLLRAAAATQDDFGAFLLLGISLLFFIQIVMNVGMTMRLFPVTGVTLPLVSYGGSSLMTHLILLGIAMSVIRYGRRGEIS